MSLLLATAVKFKDTDWSCVQYKNRFPSYRESYKEWSISELYFKSKFRTVSFSKIQNRERTNNKKISIIFIYFCFFRNYMGVSYLIHIFQKTRIVSYLHPGRFGLGKTLNKEKYKELKQWHIFSPFRRKISARYFKPVSHDTLVQRFSTYLQLGWVWTTSKRDWTFNYYNILFIKIILYSTRQLALFLRLN